MRDPEPGVRAHADRFYCNNYQDGTSGGPWITHFNPVTGTGTVIGEIGGYEEGGDYAWQSFSPYYGSVYSAAVPAGSVPLEEDAMKTRAAVLHAAHQPFEVIEP